MSPRAADPIALAGLLAEHGVLDLVLDTPGHPPHQLPPRRTDLPALLAAAGPGARLRAPAIALTLERASHGWVITAAGTPAAQAIADAI